MADMGNTTSNESADSGGRPPLQQRISSSSTTTIKTSTSSRTAGSSKDDKYRRRSIDLPDVYGKDLQFTPASPAVPTEAPDSPLSPKWPRRSNTRSARGPSPGKSTKATPTVSSTLASATSSSSAAGSSVQAVAAGAGAAGSSATTVVQPNAPQHSIGMALDAAESQAAYDATQLGVRDLSLNDVSGPSSLAASTEGLPDEPTPKETKESDAPLPPATGALPLPIQEAHPFPVLPLLSPDNKSAASSLSPISGMPPPLTPPLDTILAPLIPASVVPLPLGTAATGTASLIIGQPLPIVTRTRTPSNEPRSPTQEQPTSPKALTPAATPSPEPVPVSESPVISAAMPLGMPASAWPLPPDFVASPPPDAPIVPAAAPVSAQGTTWLAQNPQAQEAVLNATVDLDAGPDAVPTLLTWRPVGAGGEGGTVESGSQPKSVYVTGTFAKDWKTKIEMRKRGCVSFPCSRSDSGPRQGRIGKRANTRRLSP